MSKIETIKALATVDIGQLVMTVGVEEASKKYPEKFTQFLSKSLFRHMTGDWGEVDDKDKELNQEALTTGDRVMSWYKFDEESQDDEVDLWVMTETTETPSGTGIVTTMLLPSEY